MKLTDFLDPREQVIVKAVIGDACGLAFSEDMTELSANARFYTLNIWNLNRMILSFGLLTFNTLKIRQH